MIKIIRSSIKMTGLLTVFISVTRIINILYFVILARIFAVSDFGLFKYLITVAGIYAILFSGYAVALTKYISAAKEHTSIIMRYYSNTAFIMAIIYIILTIIITINEPKSLYVALFLYAALVDILYQEFSRGILDYTRLIGFKLIENIIQLAILIVVFIFYKELNFTAAVIVFCFSGTLSGMILEIYSSTKLKFSLKYLNKKIVIQLSQYAFPVMLWFAGSKLIESINTIFIKLDLSLEHVGHFSVGLTVVQIFNLIPLAISAIVLPKISNKKITKDILTKINIGIVGNLVVSIFMLAVILLFGRVIISSIFGSKYLTAYSVFLPLSLAQILLSTHQIYASIFQGIKSILIPAVTIGIGATLNVIGSYLFTAKYGILGASVSFAVSSLIITIIIVSIFYFNYWYRPTGRMC